MPRKYPNVHRRSHYTFYNVQITEAGTTEASPDHDRLVMLNGLFDVFLLQWLILSLPRPNDSVAPMQVDLRLIGP